ncbi:hypothetical protein BDEG_20112 [Batrachochytrium dendrobatidis JEL423]|uniref:Uncharacterized protein n=1 Tax=Batrachochytrium dendrobatidis (strain JEL423) TaxID=403673 RepID=A0A177W930_BATDL|nr:hypothetical protein BDEG_20112 [Batrachochytrium dendrobatidis JEL423]
MDGNTPPIYIVYDSIVSGGDFETDRRTVVITVSIFVTIVVLYIARELLGPIVWARWTTKEKLQKNTLDHKLNAERFVQNFHEILKGCIDLSFDPREIRRIPSKIVPHMFILLWLVSIIIIQNAIGNYDSSGGIPVPVIKAPQTQVGLILFFVAVNGFLIDRILSYYKERTDNRKKIQAAQHAQGNMSTSAIASPAFCRDAEIAYLTPQNAPASAVDSMSTPRDRSNSNPPSMESIRPNVRVMKGPRPINTTPNTPTHDSNTSEIQITSAETSYNNVPTQSSVSDTYYLFDKTFRYRRRIKHISPQFKHIDFTFANCVEILVLGTEFIQLASFPLRDLLRNIAFQQSMLVAQSSSSAMFVKSLRQIASTLSMGLPSINTRFLTTVQFAISWWMLLVGLIVTIIFTGLYHLLRIESFESRMPPFVLRRIRQIVSGAWVVIPLPLINLLYLIILTSLIDPLGCLSDNSTPLWPADSLANYALTVEARQRQCLPIHDGNPSLQTWYSLAGFMMGYFLLTICRTAQEPVPVDGMIHYTSRSELLFKNAAVIILLIYVLIPSETTTARGVLAIFIMSGMVAYSVLIGSSYTRSVNVIRTISFMCVMWMAIVVVYFTHSAQRELLYRTGTGVFTPIAIGWTLIAIVYTVSYLVFIMQMQKNTQLPRVPPTMDEIQDLLEQNQAIAAMSCEQPPRPLDVLFTPLPNSNPRTPTFPKNVVIIQPELKDELIIRDHDQAAWS